MSDDVKTYDIETIAEDEEEESGDVSQPAPKLVTRDENVDFTPKKTKVGPLSRGKHVYAMTENLNRLEDFEEDRQTHSRLKSRKGETHNRSHSNTHRRAPQVNLPPTVDGTPVSSSLVATVKYYFKMFSLALLCVVFYKLVINYNLTAFSFSMNGFFGKNETEKVFTPLKLINYMPAAKCYPVGPDEFVFLKGDREWNHVVQSMMYYMMTEDLDSISTFHVGHASCFMMIRQEDNSVLPMFNPNFKGYHDTVYVRVNEVSVACPQITRVVERANTIIMTSNEADRGELVIEKFNNTQAWTAQATGFYLKGKTTCDASKSNTDYGRLTLKEEIEDYSKH